MKKIISKKFMAWVLWHTGLIQLIGSIRVATRGPRLIILCYHRVDGDIKKPALSASPSQFVQQITWFSKRFSVLPLADVEDYLAGQQSLQRDSLVLTFDDGYADNYHTVLPLLRSKKLPVTFFISSDPLLNRIPYWYDTLWNCLQNWNGSLPDVTLCEKLPANLVAALTSSKQNAGNPGLQIVLDLSKGLDQTTRGKFQTWLEQNQLAPPSHTDCETMTLLEALDAVKQGIEIGGHTKSHPSLARISFPECRWQIVEGLRDLASAGFQVRFFAYPFGEAVDVGGFSGTPRKVLSEFNAADSRDLDSSLTRLPKIRLAVTTEERAVRQNDDALLLPRKVISLQDLPQIALKLELLAWQK